MPRIGLALGGGGARGLAHIPLLETLDDMGIVPSVIAGTSMGAIVGALYASGHSGRDIRGIVEELFATKGSTLERIRNTDWRRTLELVDPNFGRGGLIKGEKILSFFTDKLGGKNFKDIEAKLYLVATDFWQRSEVVFESGDLAHAVRASMAVPGVFAPVLDEGRVLVDGGMVNPLPYDLIMPHCDISIAIDVAATRKPGRKTLPNIQETVVYSFDTMQKALTDQKMKFVQPGIYLAPKMTGVGLLDFFRAGEIFEAGEKLKDDLKCQLENLV